VTVVLGLTGSIGMGKSATAGLFRERGIPVHDADLSVHALYAGRAAPLVEAAFPGTVVDGVVDRAALGARVVGDAAALKRLEAIVHPLVREEEERFLCDAVAAGTPLVVLDVPLLYETGGEGRCDAVAVVTAPAALQAERVLARPGMTAERFAGLLAKQVPDAEKRRRADFLVHTGEGFPRARADVDAILAALADRPGRGLGRRGPGGPDHAA
jgi:dephospho-CoA kinase